MWSHHNGSEGQQRVSSDVKGKKKEPEEIFQGDESDGEGSQCWLNVQDGFQAGTGRPGLGTENLDWGTGLGSGKEGRAFQGNQQALASNNKIPRF